MLNDPEIPNVLRNAISEALDRYSEDSYHPEEFMYDLNEYLKKFFKGFLWRVKKGYTSMSAGVPNYLKWAVTEILSSEGFQVSQSKSRLRFDIVFENKYNLSKVLRSQHPDISPILEKMEAEMIKRTSVDYSNLPKEVGELYKSVLLVDGIYSRFEIASIEQYLISSKHLPDGVGRVYMKVIGDTGKSVIFLDSSIQSQSN